MGGILEFAGGIAIGLAVFYIAFLIFILVESYKEGKNRD